VNWLATAKANWKALTAAAAALVMITCGVVALVRWVTRK
jgi:hypothetical protein